MAARARTESIVASVRTVGGFVALCALPLSALGQERPDVPLPSPTQNALAGSSVFGSKGCVRCHSVRGHGGTIGPDLGRGGDGRTYFRLAAGMWNHLPSMADTMTARGIEPPRLRPREAGDLIAFLYAVDYFDAGGDPATGERLFREKGCVRCHQIAGQGGVVGPDLDYLGRYNSPIQVAAAMWSHGPSMAEEFRERGIERPRFAGDELADVIAYLESTAPGIPEGPMYVLPGRSGPGRTLFRTRNCIECHGEPGGGGRVGPDLGVRARGQSPVDFAAAMWNHQPDMLEEAGERGLTIPELSPAEMADIVAYLYSSSYFGETGSFAEGAVAGTLDGVVAALWNHVALTRDTLAREIPWPELSGSDVADIAAYLRTESERP